MKKRMLAFVISAWILALALMTGCFAGAQGKKPNAPEPPVVEIRDKLFIAQVNEIYTNLDEYLDKLIRYEGLFDAFRYEDGGMVYMVIRYGPGCCGNDGNVGFEVISDEPYPNQDDWVRVEGMLERYEEWGETYVRLRVSVFEIMEEWGEAYVDQ